MQGLGIDPGESMEPGYGAPWQEAGGRGKGGWGGGWWLLVTVNHNRCLRICS